MRGIAHLIIGIQIAILCQTILPVSLHDVSKLSSVAVHQIYTPKTIEELQDTVMTCKLPIAIAGGRFSQGMHIAYPNGSTIDMTSLNKILAFDRANKTITVQSGITWREIQKHIDPFNLSIKVMQSYNDFTVGGSLSVNVHGRDIHYGPLIQTVRSLKIVCADGTILISDRNTNSDLFFAAIGGYGAVGIIVEATIELTDNTLLARKIKRLDIEDYPAYFFNKILTDPTAVLHNANWYPTEFNQVLSVTWHETDACPTITQRIRPIQSFYVQHVCAEILARWISILKTIRRLLEPEKLRTHEMVLRNYEMSHTVKILEPLFRMPTTSILQEYFIPMEHFDSFVNQFRTIAQQETINILNVSIRYVPADTESILHYAPTNSFAFVCYINILNTQSGQKRAENWTRKLVDAAVTCKGRYYLPYQPWATVEQCQQAYPELDIFRTIKKKYDPHNYLLNSFTSKYITI